MKRYLICIAFLYLAWFSYGAPSSLVIGPDTRIIEQGQSTKEIIRIINGCEFRIYPNEICGCDIDINNKRVFHITTEMLGTQLGVGLFGAEFYLEMVSPLPTDYQVIYGVTNYNGIKYHQFSVIDQLLNGPRRIYIFLFEYNACEDVVIYYFVEEDVW
jgi:hypothetical protein